MAARILELSDLISSSTKELVTLSDANGWSLPHLDESFDPAKNTFRGNAAAAEAVAKTIAAAMQLVATLMTPEQAMSPFVGGPMRSAALKVCLDSNVAEILRDAGPVGMHITEITARSGSRVDSAKLARLMRFLANRHLFKEIKLDVFAHTLISSYLDTGKPVKELLNNPDTKHDGTRGSVALFEWAVDDLAKASNFLTENMTDPNTAFSDKPTHAPFQRAVKQEITMFDWYELPEQSYRRRRFGTAMAGIASLRGDEILKQFDWTELPEGSVVVDVGGGVGTTAKFLAELTPHLQIIVQDKPGVVAAGIGAWQKHSPQLVESKRVTFQSQDFFEPQPDNKASVFLMKNVLHNWGESSNIKSLSLLRAAASPNTKLLISGSLIPHLCPPEGGESGLLLPTYGVVRERTFILDMTMLACLNAQSHTREALTALLAKSGWNVQAIYEPQSFLDGPEHLAVAVPI
ncbi:O-methyltransferase [Mycena floridula]|nr:O-methyltransferase [Mycena floridula]